MFLFLRNLVCGKIFSISSGALNVHGTCLTEAFLFEMLVDALFHVVFLEEALLMCLFA